ncbi:MAG: ABC transporter ATP-binding protein [Pirellulales bacterium]
MSQDQQPALRLDAVTKRFRGETALDNVSLSVPRGVVFAMLGANGAGKTTSIKILLGLLKPDQGRAEVLGLDSLTQSLEVRRRVGCVAERPTLYDWMTIDELGWFAAGFHDSNYLDRFRQFAADHGLSPGRRIKELSKGMRAKVALALALANDPDLLILDEPTSGLDPMVRREFLESMVDRAAAGKTVFLSSHQLTEVERVADFVGILRRGQLVMVERLERLKHELHEFTITLVPDAAQPPELAGEILRRRHRARQWQLLARGSSPDDLAVLRDSPDVADVQVRSPSLEEIFAGYMQSEDAGQGGAA